MKRYYISPIIGTGTEEDSFRPKIANYGAAGSWIIPSDPVTGHPVFDWALCIVNTNNHGAILADSAIDALPDFPLSGKISAINTAEKNAMISKLQARGVDTTFIGSADGYREVIRGIGKTLEPSFSENNFDVN